MKITIDCTQIKSPGTMKFAVASEHRDFFNKNGYIEFAELLSADQLARLNEDIRQALVNRLKLPSHAFLERLPPSELFNQGRDLWRELPAIRKMVFNPSFAEIAYEFCQERPLRIAFDQFFPASMPKNGLSEKISNYQKLLTATLSLKDLSPIQGTIGGLLICVKGDAQSPSTGIFPTTTGHGVFLSIEHPLDFNQLNSECDYLMITYAIKKSVYIVNQNDPLGHALKQCGYTFGDALKDKHHPFVLR